MFRPQKLTYFTKNIRQFNYYIGLNKAGWDVHYERFDDETRKTAFPVKIKQHLSAPPLLLDFFPL